MHGGFHGKVIYDAGFLRKTHPVKREETGLPSARESEIPGSKYDKLIASYSTLEGRNLKSTVDRWFIQFIL